MRIVTTIWFSEIYPKLLEIRKRLKWAKYEGGKGDGGIISVPESRALIYDILCLEFQIFLGTPLLNIHAKSRHVKNRYVPIITWAQKL